MATVAPHARILVVLRNPVDRFYSEYVALCNDVKVLLIVHASWGLLTGLEVVFVGRSFSVNMRRSAGCLL